MIRVDEFPIIYVFGFLVTYFIFSLIFITLKLKKYKKLKDKRETIKLSQQWEELKIGFHDSCSEHY